MEDQFGTYMGYGVGVLGILAAVAQLAWQRLFSTEGKASDRLVQDLSDRISSLEARQTKQEADLDEERRLRRLAENKVHALELDNLALRYELKRHGIDVPPAAVPALESGDGKS